MKCDGCTACCTVCGIKATDSPEGKPCRYAVPGRGCTIYDTRPEECDGFDCFYSGQPDIPEFLRPDNLGVMLEMPHGHKHYFAHRVGAIDIPKLNQLTNKLNAIGIKVYGRT